MSKSTFEKKPAHVLEKKWRSEDVQVSIEADFSSLLLSDRVLAGLKSAGYVKPSPIQLEAIPVGRFGKDLLVQAKSGTGKTLVFTIIALESLLNVKHPQVLILAPAREIATQIRDVIKAVGCEIDGLKCNSFIGGLSLEDDAEKVHGCQIIVGTPGRVKHLISIGILATNSIRLIILDEADVLLETSFKSDLDFIFQSLPKDKQVIATSATYPKELKYFVQHYFRNVFMARLNNCDLSLLGMVHYIYPLQLNKMTVLAYKAKLKALEELLVSIKFTQCLIFCNLISKVEPLCYEIRKWGFTSTFISSAKEQAGRLRAIDSLKRFRCKVLVSSDLTSRGIDAENVDLVINFDNPSNTETYFHRCGRAGRYGSKGVAITLLAEDEVIKFESMQTIENFQVYSLPNPIPSNLINMRPENTPIKLMNMKAENSPIKNESIIKFEKVDQNSNKETILYVDTPIEENNKKMQVKEISNEIHCDRKEIVSTNDIRNVEHTDSALSTTLNMTENQPQHAIDNVANPIITDITISSNPEKCTSSDSEGCTYSNSKESVPKSENFFLKYINQKPHEECQFSSVVSSCDIATNHEGNIGAEEHTVIELQESDTKSFNEDIDKKNKLEREIEDPVNSKNEQDTNIIHSLVDVARNANTETEPIEKLSDKSHNSPNQEFCEREKQALFCLRKVDKSISKFITSYKNSKIELENRENLINLPDLSREASSLDKPDSALATKHKALQQSLNNYYFKVFEEFQSKSKDNKLLEGLKNIKLTDDLETVETNDVLAVDSSKEKNEFMSESKLQEKLPLKSEASGYYKGVNFEKKESISKCKKRKSSYLSSSDSSVSEEIKSNTNSNASKIIVKKTSQCSNNKSTGKNNSLDSESSSQTDKKLVKIAVRKKNGKSLLEIANNIEVNGNYNIGDIPEIIYYTSSESQGSDVDNTDKNITRNKKLFTARARDAITMNVVDRKHLMIKEPCARIDSLVNSCKTSYTEESQNSHTTYTIMPKPGYSHSNLRNCYSPDAGRHANQAKRTTARGLQNGIHTRDPHSTAYTQDPQQSFENSHTFAPNLCCPHICQRRSFYPCDTLYSPCSRRRCHVNLHSECAQNSYSDWHDTYVNQWRYINTFSHLRQAGFY